jgi:hypothetical protein
MNARATVIGLIVSILGTTAHTAPTTRIYGYVGASCGQWTANPQRLVRSYANGSTEWKGSEAGSQMREAVLGFVSGMAMAGRELRQTDTAAIDAFVTQYCASHPLDNIATAAVALVGELQVTP